MNIPGLVLLELKQFAGEKIFLMTVLLSAAFSVLMPGSVFAPLFMALSFRLSPRNTGEGKMLWFRRYARRPPGQAGKCDEICVLFHITLAFLCAFDLGSIWEAPSRCSRRRNRHSART